MLTTKLLSLSLQLSVSIGAQEPSPKPADAPPLRFVSIAAGSAHFCAIDSDGDIQCWGDGRWGQLGNGSTESTGIEPVRVASFQRFRQVVVGSTHSCALTTDGYAYCWGSDESGVMGDATVRETCLGVACTTRPMPVAIGFRFDSLTAGFEHTCGLAHGRAYCWGRGDSGQLGAIRPTGSCRDVACSRTPSLVSDSLEFTSISARGTHTCGIASTRSLYCWGDNTHGQIDPSMGVRSIMRPMKVFAEIGFTQVSTSGLHSCAVTTNGTVECWGTNDNGRLGAADAATARASVSAQGNDRLASVSVGGTHSCALTLSGSVYCWGLNIDGRLGNETGGRCGAFDCSAVPVRVALDTPFTNIAAGGSRTCGLGRDGSVYCWGGLAGTTLTLNARASALAPK